MTSQKAAHRSCANGFLTESQRSGPIVSRPPPATGVNHDLVDKLEHSLGDRVIWHTIHSPDGSFTYDYSIKPARQRRKRCSKPECQNFLERAQRKCIECQLKTRRDRNRRHYQVLKARIKTASPSEITIDF
jgi:hypothetical protein